jgi:hypothetical protein
MYAMLKDGRAPPSGERWADLKYLETVRAYRPRHASTLLVFDAVVDALDAREGRRTTEPLAAATKWIERYRQAWEESVGRLDALLDELQGGGGTSPKSE